MILNGYIVGTTEKSIAFVRQQDAKDGVRPLYIPLSQILSSRSMEAQMPVVLHGEKIARRGQVAVVEITDSFAEKIWLLASA